MKQLHYTFNPQDNSITLIHKSGTNTTITIGPDLLKKLNYYAQTVPNEKDANELIKINEDLHRRYHYCAASKTNSTNRANNIDNIIKLEKRRQELHNNITCQSQTPTTQASSKASTTHPSPNSQESLAT